MTDTLPSDPELEQFHRLTDETKRTVVSCLLRELGDDSIEIATAFWDGQHVGLRCHPTINPVSDYLADRIGISPWLIVLGPKMVTVDGVNVQTYTPLRRFMQAFDQGDYPHLVVNA